MDLERLYTEVCGMIGKLDLGSIWPGFRPLKFALYNDDACFFDGRYVERTDEFLANTSIVYEGEQIAIWNITEEMEIPVLASKIVHEMFHGYQKQEGWDCWAHELQALCRYRYQSGNLCLKMRENELFLSLLDRYDKACLRELLAHRKLRSESFPYEFSYESKVEEIEGTANYVEWQALTRLDGKKASELTESMRRDLERPERLFPVRISCYFSGALLVHALRIAGLYDFRTARRPVIFSLLEEIQPSDGSFPEKESVSRTVSRAVSAYERSTEETIRAALQKNETALEGPCTLLGLNVYDARHLGEYITATSFLMVRAGEENTMLRGDFVIHMRDERTVDKVYRFP